MPVDAEAKKEIQGQAQFSELSKKYVDTIVTHELTTTKITNTNNKKPYT